MGTARVFRSGNGATRVKIRKPSPPNGERGGASYLVARCCCFASNLAINLRLHLLTVEFEFTEPCISTIRWRTSVAKFICPVAS